MLEPQRVFIAPLRFWYEVSGGKSERWGAGYKIDVQFRDGKSKPAIVVIDGVECDECPRSLMLRNPELVTLVETFNHDHSIKGGLGSPQRWPGAFYDAMGILSTQEKIDKAARRSAVHSV